MPLLTIYVDPETLVRLRRAARERERTVEDLAESAVAEAALDDDRRRAGEATAEAAEAFLNRVSN